MLKFWGPPEILQGILYTHPHSTYESPFSQEDIQSQTVQGGAWVSEVGNSLEMELHTIVYLGPTEEGDRRKPKLGPFSS